MSGTSLDGVDAVLADLAPADGRRIAVLAHVHRPFAPALRAELLALNAPGADELHRAALAASGVARTYADAVAALLAGRPAAVRAAVAALGAHGQTVRHRPGEFDGTGYTVQLLNGALLAELAGIDVVCDLRAGRRRRRPGRAAGAGVPPRGVRRAAADRAVLNLGGMANLTVLRRRRIDARVRLRPGQRADGPLVRAPHGRLRRGGAWAASGRVAAGAAGGAAAPSPTSRGATQEHRPRPFQRRLARQPPARARRWGRPRGRAGDAGRAGRARLRRGRSRATRRGRARCCCAGAASRTPPRRADARALAARCRARRAVDRRTRPAGAAGRSGRVRLAGRGVRRAAAGQPAPRSPGPRGAKILGALHPAGTSDGDG